MNSTHINLDATEFIERAGQRGYKSRQPIRRTSSLELNNENGLSIIVYPVEGNYRFYRSVGDVTRITGILLKDFMNDKNFKTQESFFEGLMNLPKAVDILSNEIYSEKELKIAVEEVNGYLKEGEQIINRFLEFL